MYTPTPGSRLKAKSSWPMPRIEADNTELSPEKGAPASRFTFGVSFVSARISETPRLCKASAVNAVTAIGTSCRFCSRRVAVTTTSSSWSPVAANRATLGMDNTAMAAIDLPSREPEPFINLLFMETP